MERRQVTQIVVGGIVLTGVALVAWFGFHDGSPTPNVDKGDPDRFSTSETNPLSTPTTEAINTSINTVQPVTIYASDNTPFDVIYPAGHEDEICAEVGGPFNNVAGQRHDAGRLAQALGNGNITFNINGQPITIDTDANPFPSQLSLVHAEDFACK